MDEFEDENKRRKYKTFHYGAYIVRTLSAFGVPFLSFNNSIQERRTSLKASQNK